MKLTTAIKKDRKQPLPQGWCPECRMPSSVHWVGKVCRDCHERKIRHEARVYAGTLESNRESAN